MGTGKGEKWERGAKERKKNKMKTKKLLNGFNKYQKKLRYKTLTDLVYHVPRQNTFDH